MLRRVYPHHMGMVNRDGQLKLINQVTTYGQKYMVEHSMNQLVIMIQQMMEDLFLPGLVIHQAANQMISGLEK